MVLAVAAMLGGCGGSSDPGTRYIETSINQVFSSVGSKEVSAWLVDWQGTPIQENVALTEFSIVSHTSILAPTITDVVQDPITLQTTANVTITEPGTYVIKASIGSLEKTFTLGVIALDAGPDRTVALGSTVTLTGNTSPAMPTGLSMDFRSKDRLSQLSIEFNSYWTHETYLSSTNGFVEPGSYLYGSFPLQRITPINPIIRIESSNGNVASLVASEVGQHVFYYCATPIGDSGYSGKYYKVCDPITITVVEPTIPPVADPGTARTVAVGDSVTLNGSASTDTYGLPLAYSWSLTSKPGGSDASLTNATAVDPSFTAGVAGDYVISLTVDNGHLSSTAATVTITASPLVPPNNAPVADAGTAQTVTVGDLVTLDGSASSDADGDTLSYAWGIISAPSGSTAVLANDTTALPTFTPDVAGDYVIDLDVYDGVAWSQIDTVTVTADPSGGGTPAYVTDTITLLQNNTFLVSHSSAPNGLLEVFEFGDVGPGGSMSFAYIDPVSVPTNRSSTWNVIDGGGFALASESIMMATRYLNSAAPVDSTGSLIMTGYEGYATGLAGSSVENWIKAATVTAADFNGKTVVDYIDSTIQYVFTTTTTGEYTADTINPPQAFDWSIDSSGQKAVLTFSNGSTHSLYLTVRQAGFTTVREMGVVTANGTGFVSGGSLKSWRW